MAEHVRRGRPRGGGARRNAERGNDPNPRDIEIDRLRQRIQELELLQQEETTESDHTWEPYEDENPFGRYRPDVRGGYRDDPLRGIGMKVEIPEFSGKVHPDDFIDWLSTVERVFDLKDIPEHLKLVAIRLRKHASLWWDHVKKQRALAGKSKVVTWEKMKKLLKAKFLPDNHRQEAFLDYHNLSQRTLTVEELINEFDRLRMRCDANEEDEQVVARFLGCLRPEISDVVNLQQYLTYSDVCRLALKVEKQQNKIKGKTSVGRFTPVSKSTPTIAAKGKIEPATSSSVTGNHIRAPRCFKCQGLGHYARDCPNQKIVTIVDEEIEPVYDTDGEGDELINNEEVVYADHGEALVIQRVLNVAASQSIDNNSWLRNSIFRTKYQD
ncbi:reverse transcriptase domain-containing protein [Artemisia annua]|uniref:Reverse transcriptase domain-containing protein n=1 Tax=Artemisia annua TaxID=35608 RepID=A0A2U1P1F3_ARTAN|nr:reverse transcriptase domain-containing protein [Artemisia annua]